MSSVKFSKGSPFTMDMVGSPSIKKLTRLKQSHSHDSARCLTTRRKIKYTVKTLKTLLL